MVLEQLDSEITEQRDEVSGDEAKLLWEADAGPNRCIWAPPEVGLRNGAEAAVVVDDEAGPI